MTGVDVSGARTSLATPSWPQPTLRALRRTAERIVQRGAAVGVQAALRTADGRRLDFVFGRTHDGAELTVATRFPLACHTRTVTAALVLEALNRDGHHPDEPLARFLPEFGAGGKSGLTVRQLLTDTAGLDESAGLLTDGGRDLYSRFGRICRLARYEDWDPDTDACYSPVAGYEALGHLVEHLTGQRFADYFDATLGPHTGALGFLTDFQGYQRRHAAVAAPWTLYTQMPLSGGARPARVRPGAPKPWPFPVGNSPAVGAVGSARDVCALWWALSRAASGERGHGVSPATARLMVNGRRGMRYDRYLDRERDYGHGVMTDLAKGRPWGYPAELTARSYGHLGLSQVLGGCLPEYGASFAVVVNGRTSRPVEFAALRLMFGALIGNLGG